MGEPIVMGKNNAHIRMDVDDGSEVMEVVGFNFSYLIDKIDYGSKYDIVYTPMMNNWKGNNRIQLKLVDIRKSDI